MYKIKMGEYWLLPFTVKDVNEHPTLTRKETEALETDDLELAVALAGEFGGQILDG